MELKIKNLIRNANKLTKKIFIALIKFWFRTPARTKKLHIYLNNNKI